MLEFLEAFISGFGFSLQESALWVLFMGGFLSATILPGGSEAALIATLNLHQYPTFTIIAIATLGNTLGGMVNYGIGIWLPNRTQENKRGQKSLAWLRQYGYWALLFSWLPVIGDAMCIAAGWLRMRFLPSMFLILIGKAIRYAILAALFYGLF
ncbi:YqaA family protein [Vibrio spartinae]|uniref:Inner membrane protein YqaA n=1 Tax=Vibrio spartinae TaxID=1918945 RepID=A0A1N6M1C8_9VIBR|nr:YqaA family protein [Vibrio spartinae]QMV15384.1 Inner membrane protein YqaA [Vibrio spartinae]SIO93254.1 Inner membrane protein YqaA [Vibrio spartinae]